MCTVYLNFQKPPNRTIRHKANEATAVCYSGNKAMSNFFPRRLNGVASYFLASVSLNDVCGITY